MKNPLNHWRVRREDKPVPVKEVAKKLHVTAPAVYLWERGAARPRRSQWKRIARLMDLSVTDLITRWANWHASLGNEREAEELRLVAKYFDVKPTRFSLPRKQPV